MATERVLSNLNLISFKTEAGLQNHIDELQDGDLVFTPDNSLKGTLLDYKWADHLLNDMSWLRADTFSWHSGDVYVAAYNHLVADFEGTTAETETIGDITITFYRAEDKHKICLPDQEDKLLELYNKTGVAWYYILDEDNTQFKLPRTKYGFTGLRDEVGGYVEPGLPDHTHDISFYSNFGWNGGYRIGSSDRANDQYLWEFTSTPASESNKIYKDGETVQPPATQMYLYFYVGNFERDAVEQTAGLNAELFNQKMDNGTPLIRDIFSPDEWENESMEQILSAGVGSGDLVFIKNWQEYDYLWFSSVADSSNALDDSPHWLNVKWLLSQAKAGVTNLAVVRYSSGAYWYVNPQAWTETTMPEGSGNESLWINKVYGIKLKNITAKNVGLLNYKGLFETASALVATVPTAMGQWVIVGNDETQGGLQTKYFSTKDVSGNFVWAFGGVIDSSLVGADYVVESQLPTAENGYTWYRKYASGWVEQGGHCTGSIGYTVTFVVPFADTNYIAIAGLLYSHAGTICNVGCTNFTTTSMDISIADNTQGNNRPACWQASGKSA